MTTVPAKKKILALRTCGKKGDEVSIISTHASIHSKKNQNSVLIFPSHPFTTVMASFAERWTCAFFEPSVSDTCEGVEVKPNPEGDMDVKLRAI